MSAPVTHDPLVVNTQDGCCWTRRAVNRAGRGLYALADVQGDVPVVVLATLPELAEHGLASMAFALPVPVGSGPQPVDVVDQREQAEAWEGHILGAWDGEFAMESGLDRAVLKLARMVKADVTELERLRAELAALRAERHSTNEALDDAVRALRALERQPEVDGITRVIAPTQALQPVEDDVSPQVQRLRALLAGQREAVDGEHYAAVHHSYRVGRDLPELGGQR